MTAFLNWTPIEVHAHCIIYFLCVKGRVGYFFDRNCAYSKVLALFLEENLCCSAVCPFSCIFETLKQSHSLWNRAYLKSFLSYVSWTCLSMISKRMVWEETTWTLSWCFNHLVIGHHIRGQVKTVNTNPVVQEPFPDISIQHHSPHIEIFSWGNLWKIKDKVNSFSSN